MRSDRPQGSEPGHGAEGRDGVIVAGPPSAGDNYAAGIGRSNCRHALTRHSGRSGNLIVAEQEKKMSLDTPHLKTLLTTSTFSCLASWLHEPFALRLPLLLLVVLLASGHCTVTSWFRAAAITDDFRPAYTTCCADANCRSRRRACRCCCRPSCTCWA